MLIGLCGQKRVGKDTGAELLINNYGFKRFAFADALKNACKNIFLLDDEQVNGKHKETIDERWNISPREIFQKFGTEIFRNNLDMYFPNLKDHKQNFWVYRFKLWIKEEYKKNPDQNIVITDIRFPNEMQIVKDFGGIIIKIKRNTFESIDNHSSEVLIDSLKEDYLIYNDGSKKTYYEKINKIYLLLKNK